MSATIDDKKLNGAGLATLWGIIKQYIVDNPSIPKATASTLGCIMVGTTLGVNNSGVLNLASGVVTAGTYKSVTVDTYGRVTAGTNPNTLAGYGITDAKISNGSIILGENSITPITSLSGYATQTWVQQQGYLTEETYKGTVTQVKVGTTAYDPTSGVVSLPSYPTTLPASDVYSWAKAASKPSYTASEVGAATSGHTHTTSLASDSGTSTITLASAGKYKLTAGGTSVIFTMPTIPTVSYPVTSVNSKTGAVTLTASEVGAATSGHTHTTSIATSTGTNQITLAHGGKYAITAGGTSYIFTMPSDNNTTYSAGTGLSLSGTTFSLATSGVTAGTYKRVTVDAYGRVTSGDNTDANDNTWRNIYTGGTSRVSTGTDTKAINFVAGSNVSISYEAAGTGSGQSGNANYFNVKIAATDTTYSAATQSAAGLMSAADKKKLDGIASGANAYSLPTASADTLGGIKVGTTLSISSGVLNLATSGVTAGTYKRVTVDSYGRVTSGDNTDADTNTWRGIYVKGTSSIGTGNDTKALNFAAGSNISISFAAAGTGSGQSGNANYGTITINATDTTYSAATQSAAGLMSAADKKKLDGIASGANAYSLPAASTSALGGIKVNYTNSGKNYKVQLDSSNNAYVNVPWENTTYTFTNKGATLAWSTTSTIATVGGVDIKVTMPANPNTDHYAWTDITGKPSTFAPSSHSHSTIVGSYTSSGGQQKPNYFGTNKVGFLMMNTTVNSNSQYKDWIIMDCYNGSDVGGGVAFGVNRQSLGAYIMRSAAERTAWAESAELLGTHNYDSYAAKKTEAIKSISRSGTTFTATRCDGTTFTFTQQDNNTTYTLAGLMGSTAIGGTTQPIYWTGSAFAKTTYTLGKSVPSDAVFTDTNTWRTVQCNGTSIGNNTLNLKAGTNVSLSNSNGAITITSTDTNTWRPIGTGASDAAAGNHTHTLSIATDSGTNAITLAHGTKYKLTAGGSTLIFTMPTDNNTTYSSKTAASGGTDVSLVTTGEKYTWNNKSNLSLGTTSTTAAKGDHTHGLSIATSTGTNALTLAANTKYVLTAGGSTFIFTTPPDNNTTYTLAGLMGSSAKGGSTTPVYWNGSAWTNCTAYSSASVNYAASAGSVDWGNITNKPTAFTAASHTHTKSDITDFGSYLPTSGGNITGAIYLIDDSYIFSYANHEGYYLDRNGIHWHNSSNGYSSSLLGLNSELITVYPWLNILNGIKSTVIGNGTYNQMQWRLYSNHFEFEFPNLTDSSSGSHVPIYMGWRGGVYPLTIAANTNIGIGTTSPSYKLHVNGAVGATGFTNTSDMRKKNVVKENLSIRLNAIANAPLFDFTWKDASLDKDLHIGSSAQYWKNVIPEAVTIAQDEMCTLSMQYDVIAFASIVSVAKETVTLKEKVALLETRVESLEKKIREYESN